MKAQLISNRTPAEYGKVAVLLGGNSAERSVSLRSGEAIYNGLIQAGIDAIKIDPVDGLYQSLVENQVERVFIALHGRDGEDGVVQGFLKILNIPFTGSDVASSAIAMNKLVCKQIWQQLKITTAKYVFLTKGKPFTERDAEEIFSTLGPVLFVKPVCEGSSVGMSKVKTLDELIAAVALAHQYDEKILVERFISGKEYTVSIIKGIALPSISMQTPRDFYDYQAKYQSNLTQYFCPSGLSEADEKKLAKIALNAFAAIGCSGWGRVDFIRDGDSGEFYILEANTIPGMTETSLVPKAAKATGIEFAELVKNILDTSFEKVANPKMIKAND